MVLESNEGTLYRRNNRVYIYVPADIARDSAFPFTFKRGHVKIRIDVEHKTLTIGKVVE